MQYLNLVLGLLAGLLIGGWEVFRRAKNYQLQAKEQLDTISTLSHQVVKLETEKNSLEQNLGELRHSQKTIQDSLTECQKKLGALEAEKKLLQEQLLNQTTEREKDQKLLREQFENLTQKIFEEKSQKFNDLNLNSLKQLIEPFKTQIKDFEKRVEDTYSNERMERGTLKGELNKLMELNLRMSSETENLTKALKGDVKVQGNWGEFVLESILERCGLREGEEFILQGQGMGLKSESENSTQKPDVLVKLPDNKFLIVDSKVSLKSFEAYINCDDASEQERLAKEHVESLRKHIEGLSGKKYHHLDELESPDFTLLFMPLEPAFALAFRIKPDLLQLAWDKQIAIVSPTTLLTTLRTVASLWKQQRQNKNTLEIAKAGGALYDKFLGLLEGIEQVGSRLRQTHEAYEEVLNRMSHGKGNLLRQVERLKELGAKTERSIESKSLGRQLLSAESDLDLPISQEPN